MKLKTPSFWYRPNLSEISALEKILTPLSLLYGLGHIIHQHNGQRKKFGMPVVCIGNINAGGTGKTPTALALMRIIREQSLARNPYFLLRGYGGGEIGPIAVDLEKHTAWQTGDEALILAESAPTVTSADRCQGAALAAQKGADLIVMDDGLQNPGIHKDIKIIVINGAMGFGNGKMLPAGPLRSPLSSGLAQADAFILIGKDERNILSALPAGKPVFEAYLTAEDTLDANKNYIAFAGIGYPDKFFSFLKNDLKYNVVESIPFPDHYPYEEKDLVALHKKAQTLGATLITTPKDFLRLPAVEGIKVQSLRTRLVWNDEHSVSEFLKTRLSAWSP